MFNLDRDKETICAVITAPGVGGISVIRVSGEHALAACRGIAVFLPEYPESHKVYYGFAQEVSSGSEFDEVLATYFEKGRSFTGEQTVEISCHGGDQVSSLLIRELIFSGVRLAEKGEFTYRAFMSGRIDLIQAESVLALIESKSSQAGKLALRQLKGELSLVLEELEDKLVWVQAHFEANIDFSEEDIDVCDWGEIDKKLRYSHDKITEILKSYRSGKILSEGLKIGIAGRPNVGKSSLLNCILKEDKAIVSAVPGTTRDVIEGHIKINGTPVLFVDTAGLRESDDIVEKIGIGRARKVLAECDYVVLVVDLNNIDSFDAINEVSLVARDKLLVVGNKCDGDVWAGKGYEFNSAFFSSCLASDYKIDASEEGYENSSYFTTSALTGEGVSRIQAYLSEVVSGLYLENSIVLTQNRHFELLTKVAQGLDKTIASISEDLSPEFLVFELQEAILAIHEILGKQFDDQVMDRVFKEFCLGK